MRNFLRNSEVCRHFAALPAALCTGAFCVTNCLYAQELPRKLSPAEFKHATQGLASTAIPRFAGSLKTDAEQSFVIPGANNTSLTMVPVRYESRTPATGYEAPRCGIFFFGKREHAPNFVPTMGYDFTETLECASLTAIGFMPVAGSEYPRLLLVYKAGTLNGVGPAPIVMDYSGMKGAYVPNETLSTHINDAPRAITIANMKAELRSMGK